MKKTLLFVTYGGGHAQMVCPVVAALKASEQFQKGELDIKVLGLPAAKKTLLDNGVDAIGFRDYLDPETDQDAIAWGEKMAESHHSPTIGADLEDSVAYLGLSFKDLVVRFGQEEAERMLAEKSRQAFFPLTIMDRIFDDLQPEVVVATNSPRSEAAAIATAHSRGIASLVMTDLFTGWIGYQFKAKHVTFLNEFAKDMFVADGLVNEEASEVHFTGNPAFDRILNLPKEKDPDWLSEHFPEAGEKKLVLHADMPAYWHAEKKCPYNKTEQDTLEELEACYQATVQNNAVYLIRPHPSQDRKFFETWLQDKENAYLAADCDLHELLANIDLVIARTTTVCVEAAYMQKKILQLDCDFHSDLPLAKMGIAWGVNRYDDLEEEIASALRDEIKFEKINDQVERMFPREPAANKIANIILEQV